MKHTLKWSVVLALLLVVVAAESRAGERRFEKKFTVSAGGTFTIKTDRGQVNVVGGNGGEVAIVAELHGSQRDIDEFDITAQQSGNDVEVTGRGRRSSWKFFGSDDMDITFTVRVPAEYNLQMQTAGGDIAVESVKGVVRGKTSGGDLTVRNVEGGIDLHTSGGNVKASSITGSLAMETSGGDVEIASTTGSVDVRTSGGNIRVNDVDGKVSAETSGGNVVVGIRNDNKGVRVRTSGGNIDVMLARDVAATVDASTSGGEVVCDFPITMTGKVSEKRLRGSINGGGNTILARTSGGDIHIRTNQ